MKQIWKYEIAPSRCTEVSMPAGAKVLHMGAHGGVVCIWAEVDPRMEAEETRRFQVLATGCPMPVVPLTYIGTVMVGVGVLVWHVFEEEP